MAVRSWLCASSTLLRGASALKHAFKVRADRGETELLLSFSEHRRLEYVSEACNRGAERIGRV